MSKLEELATYWTELPDSAAVQPVGAVGLLGVAGRKNWPGIHAYQIMPIGLVADAPLLKVKLYVYVPLPVPEIVPLGIWPWAQTRSAADVIITASKAGKIRANFIDDTQLRAKFAIVCGTAAVRSTLEQAVFSFIKEMN